MDCISRRDLFAPIPGRVHHQGGIRRRSSSGLNALGLRIAGSTGAEPQPDSIGGATHPGVGETHMSANTMITPELLDQLLANYEKPEDPTGDDGLFKQLKKALIKRAFGGNHPLSTAG
jgi:hypothetical protein